MQAKPKSLEGAPVVVIADWDADGATSAAMIYYAQRYKGVYPLRGGREVALYPSGPRGFPDALAKAVEGKVCPEALVVLDIPLADTVYGSLRSFLARCRGSRLIYIDHHFSTIHEAGKLYELTEEVLVGHKPTALLTYKLLQSVGLRRLTPRLEAFMRAVGVLEKERRPQRGEDKLVKLAASISKATTVLRDEELWRKLVLWLASPLPSETPFDMRLVEKVLEVARRSDREIEEKAKMLAFEARRVGYIKFVDARGKWSGRGASALASKLYKILKQPVAVLVERDDGVRLLIVRTRGRSAYRLAVGLLEEGVAENIGGHSSLAVARLKPGVDIDRLLDVLRRLSLRA